MTWRKAVQGFNEAVDRCRRIVARGNRIARIYLGFNEAVDRCRRIAGYYSWENVFEAGFNEAVDRCRRIEIAGVTTSSYVFMLQ